MEKQININQGDFLQILNTAEILIDKVALVLGNDAIVKERVNDICQGKIKGKTEEDYNEYLKKRGIRF